MDNYDRLIKVGMDLFLSKKLGLDLVGVWQKVMGFLRSLTGTVNSAAVQYSNLADTAEAVLNVPAPSDPAMDTIEYAQASKHADDLSLSQATEILGKIAQAEAMKKERIERVMKEVDEMFNIQGLTEQQEQAKATVLSGLENLKTQQRRFENVLFRLKEVKHRSTFSGKKFRELVEAYSKGNPELEKKLTDAIEHATNASYITKELEAVVTEQPTPEQTPAEVPESQQTEASKKIAKDTYEDIVNKTRQRFETMDDKKLEIRLYKLTNPDKIKAFIEVADELGKTELADKARAYTETNQAGWGRNYYDAQSYTEELKPVIDKYRDVELDLTSSGFPTYPSTEPIEKDIISTIGQEAIKSNRLLSELVDIVVHENESYKAFKETPDSDSFSADENDPEETSEEWTPDTLEEAIKKVKDFVASKTPFYLETGDLLGLIGVYSEKEGGWFVQGGDWGDPSGGPYDDAEVLEKANHELSPESFGYENQAENLKVHDFNDYDTGHHNRYDAWEKAQPDVDEAFDADLKQVLGEDYSLVDVDGSWVIIEAPDEKVDEIAKKIIEVADRYGVEAYFEKDGNEKLVMWDVDMTMPDKEASRKTAAEIEMGEGWETASVTFNEVPLPQDQVSGKAYAVLVDGENTGAIFGGEVDAKGEADTWVIEDFPSDFEMGDLNPADYTYKISEALYNEITKKYQKGGSIKTASFDTILGILDEITTDGTAVFNELIKEGMENWDDDSEDSVIDKLEENFSLMDPKEQLEDVIKTVKFMEGVEMIPQRVTINPPTNAPYPAMDDEYAEWVITKDGLRESEDADNEGLDNLEGSRKTSDDQAVKLEIGSAGRESVIEG